MTLAKGLLGWKLLKSFFLETTRLIKIISCEAYVGWENEIIFKWSRLDYQDGRYAHI